MKTKLLLIKVFTFLIFGCISISNLVGQDSYIKNRWNFKAGYARYTSSYSGHGNLIDDGKIGHYRIEANYGIFDYLETGVFLGYSKYSYLQPIPVDSFNSGGYSVKDNNTCFYGVNCNFQILPFLIRNDDFRFDLYLTGNLCGISFANTLPYSDIKYLTEYALGGGISIYLGRHIGLFMEYLYGKFPYGDKTKLRYGLTLKF